MALHAKLGASGSHRWLNCPGSIKAEEPYPNKTSPYAEEGTIAHELAERALREGQHILDNHHDREMADYVQVYVDYVHQTFHGSMYCEIEKRVDYGEWVPEGFGTADAISLKDDVLYVTDLKYGRGVPVSAFENTQGMLYALGAYSMVSYMSDINKVVISIVQPRLDSISVWETDVERLLAFGEYASQRAELTTKDDAPRNPSEKACQFCRAKHECPALMKLTHDSLLGEFDDLEPLNKLTQDQMRKALDNKKLIESWLSAIETHVKGELEEGRSFDGYKLVEGRSSRSWHDEDEVASVLKSTLGDKAYTAPKLVTPPQAEKLLGKVKWQDFSDYVKVTKSSPSLAKEDDKRPQVNVSVDDF